MGATGNETFPSKNIDNIDNETIKSKKSFTNSSTKYDENHLRPLSPSITIPSKFLYLCKNCRDERR